MDYRGKVGFVIGTGRCGTVFYAKLGEMEPHVAASHERFPLNETFHRYCKWYELPVDSEGFLQAKEREIREDLAHKSFSREMFLARIAPKGPHFSIWNAMTPIGKIAWFYRAYTEKTLEKLNALPDGTYRLVRIEDFDHEAYVEASRFLGYEPQVTKASFDALAASRPHSFSKKKEIFRWTKREVHEFEEQVAPIAERLGYPFRVKDILQSAYGTTDAEAVMRAQAPAPTGPRFWRLRKTVASYLSRMSALVDPS